MKKALVYIIVCIFLSSCDSCIKKTIYYNTVVVHAAPFTSAVDFFEHGKILKSSINYGDQTLYLSNSYVEGDIPSAIITQAGTNNSLAVIQQFPAQSDKKFSVFFYKKDTNYVLNAILDDFTTPPAGQSAVRYVNLGSSSTAPALDILLTGTEIADNVPLWNVYGTTGFTSFSNFAVGIYTLQVRLHGTTTIVYTLPNVTLADGKVYTFYSTGVLSGAIASFKVGIETHN